VFRILALVTEGKKDGVVVFVVGYRGCVARLKGYYK
jgi:hypothetical protein